MRRRAVIVPIVLLASVVVAWRRRRARAARRPLGASPTPAPVGARTPVASLPAPAPEPAPGEPPSLAHDLPFVSVPWTLADAPGDRAELTVRFAGHPQLALDRVDAQETPSQVFVTVLMRRRAAAADADGEAPPEQQATVALSGPLGARELVHAPADWPPAAGGEPSDPPLYP